MHYRVYLKTARSDRWWPITRGALPRKFAMYSDAFNAMADEQERGYFNGQPIVDTMIMSVDEMIFATEDGEHKVTLLELC